MKLGTEFQSVSGGAKATLKRVEGLPEAYMETLIFSEPDYSYASIVIPFYNRKDMVVACVDSVIFNAPIGTEIIAVDDGSSDGAIEEVISKYGSVVSVRLPENRGVAAARNAGNSVASNEVIIDLDSDDLLLPGAVEAVLREVSNGAGFVYGNALKQAHGGAQAPTNRPEWRPNILFDKGCFFVGLKGYLKSAWEMVGGFNEKMRAAVDLDFALRLEELGVVFARAQEQLVVYREHGGQISSANFVEQNECARQAFEAARKRRGLSVDEVG